MLPELLNALLIRQLSPLPVCGTDCEDNLPETEFDECNPEINEGQIAKVYITNRDNPLTDWTDPAEWNLRLDNSSADPDAIRTLHVIGDKPAPSSNDIELSLGRTVKSKKDHLINIAVDETNAVNHEFLRENECSGQYLMWYETLDGLLFGGNEGIEVSLNLDMIIPQANNELITFSGTANWKSKFTEERTDSPI